MFQVSSTKHATMTVCEAISQYWDFHIAISQSIYLIVIVYTGFKKPDSEYTFNLRFYLIFWIFPFQNCMYFLELTHLISIELESICALLRVCICIVTLNFSDLKMCINYIITMIFPILNVPYLLVRDSFWNSAINGKIYDTKTQLEWRPVGNRESRTK